MIFDKNKADIFIHVLKIEPVPLSSMENIENLYIILLQPSRRPLTISLLKSRLKRAIVEPTLGMIKDAI